MPEARGLVVSISCFVDDDLAGNKVNHRSQTGVPVFVNCVPIHWFSNK